MKRWLRVVLPPSEYVLLFLVLYTAVFSVSVWIATLTSNGGGIEEQFFFSRDCVVMLAAIAYGGFRVFAFHPICRDKYLAFVKSTAWTPEKPLPCGPVHWVWQDAAVIVFLIALILYEPFIYPLRAFQVAAIAFYFGLSAVFASCRLWKAAYGLLFGAGLAILFWMSPFLSTAICLALYFVAYRGIRGSLHVLFVTPADELLSNASLSTQAKNRGMALRRLERLSGWPYDVLSGHLPVVRFWNIELTGIPAIHGLLCSLLAGWLVFAISVPLVQTAEASRRNWAEGFVEQVGRETMLSPQVARALVKELRDAEQWAKQRNLWVGYALGFMYVSFALVITRLSTYCKGHSPPINIWGRLFTGRLIIPAYDKVFIAPLCLLASVGAVFPLLVSGLGLSPIFAGPIVVFLMVFCTLSLGPSRAEWLLTSPCRITPSADYKSKQFGLFENV